MNTKTIEKKGRHDTETRRKNQRSLPQPSTKACDNEAMKTTEKARGGYKTLTLVGTSSFVLPSYFFEARDMNLLKLG